MEEDRYIDLLLKEADEQISEQEQLELTRWLEESEDNRAQAKRIRRAWDLSAKPPKSISVDVDQQYKIVKEKISKTPPAQSQTIQLKSWQIAAGILLLIGFSWISYRLLKSPSINMHAYQGPNAKVELADGSNIWLDQNTEFQFTESETIRQGRLSGKGYFEIKEDPAKPFEIVTSLGKVTVVGTSFEIDASTLNQIIVKVSEGQVRLSNDQEAVIELSRGEVGTITSSGLGKTNYSQPAGSWRLQPQIFDQISLDVVLQEIEEKYLIRFETELPSIRDCKISLTLSYPPIDDLISILEILLNAQITNQGPAQFYITGGGC